MKIRTLVLLPALLAVYLFIPIASVFADATTTPEATTTPSTATIIIRDGDITAFSDIVELAATTTSPVDIAPTGSSDTVPVAADSILATLVALDATTADFDITDLAYFTSFNSFIINCIAIPAVVDGPHCFNWTYAVNGVFPQVGVDDYLLEDGDIAHLFFGSQRQTILSTTTVISGESFTATAQHYDLDSGSYLPSPSLIIGVGTANPDFSFTELATSTSDSNGEAIFTLSATGTYAVGIQEDFYFPSASITILDAEPVDEEDGDPPADPPSGGGGEIVHLKLDVPSALAFLSSAQESDGSYSASLYTDWVAVAFAAADPGEAKTKLINYLEQATPALSSVTDYERHAIALMALGINPYNGTPTDYITPIVDAFDGTQIGDPALDNDDIFALFPLLHAGYGPSDTIIQKVAEFILSRQGANGSWDESADMTAAAIQAIGGLHMIPGVNASMGGAAGYLVSTQQANGGWDNVDSTSWVQTAINAINEVHPAPESAWTSSGGLYPNDAIADAQQTDGGVRDSSESNDLRVWSTSYAITAAAGKNWLSLMQSFSPPSEPPAPASSGGGGGVIVTIIEATTTAATSTTATSTAATSTPATSTPDVLGVSTSTGTTTSGTAVQTTQETSTTQSETTGTTQETSGTPTSESGTENTSTGTSTSTESQLAAAGSVSGDLGVSLVLALLLILSALLGAFTYTPLMRLFLRLFR